MSPALSVTMASILLGFLCFGGSFYAFSTKAPAKVTWTLLVVAIFFISVIPTTVAVFFAAG